MSKFAAHDRSTAPLSDTVYASVTMAAHDATRLDGFAVSEVRGRTGVLACADALVELAARCGQRGIVDYLAFHLSVPYFGSKLPSVFLLYPPPGQILAGSRESPAGAPFAAVLLNEYRLLGLRTGVYIPADLAGDWTVIAPEELRSEVAAHLGAYLLRHRAWLAILSIARPQAAMLSPGTTPSRELRSEARAESRAEPRALGTAYRPSLRTLPLRDTLDATLAAMGSHTRRNLRLARRQALEKVGATFVPNAPLSEEEFLRINREGFYPVPDRVARWRYQSSHKIDGGFMAAVRAEDGAWLAVLGGRRYLTADGACTAVDWQLNRTSFSGLSPGSLMRILLIEHELTRGTTHLRFEGGTPHSMRSAFDPEVVTDHIYARRPLSPKLLRWLGRVLPTGNLLGDLLLSRWLTWRA